MRLIGVGLSGINKFCGLMELGTGISSSIYYKIIDSISIAVKSVFDVVMLKAVREEKLSKVCSARRTRRYFNRKESYKEGREKNPSEKSAAKTVVAKKRKTVVKKNPAVKTQDLTIKLMKKLSRNYGLAIQRHPDSVEEMRKEIWAGFFHKISTDSNPQHSYCSETWCKYKITVKNNSVHKFKHPPALAKDVQEVLKPIYDDLTKQELLERCLGGNTQNNNESFNNCVWSMAPKHIFCGKKIVKIACQTAACIFNEGFHPVLKILEVMGVKIGSIAAQLAADCDRTRIRVANRRSTEAYKEARTKRRQAILDENEHYEEDVGIMYGAGIAD
ncbi:unnamed protein product [Euphydryas editha]|uniref:Uncharacterized protein n=1 Tax=Euphydryas editha TaxID=104508 RepID=A0AAU9V4C1_EUPED|nr:unnamed protein product [Euphydryas editha]